MKSKLKPRVGVGVVIMKGGKVLLLKRKGSHGSGSWAFIGGHLEFGETPEVTAIREVAEEIGVSLKNLKRIGYTIDYFPKEQKHYVTLYIKAELDSGQQKVLDKEKISELEWFEWVKLPKPLFIPVKNFIKEGLVNAVL